jgi:hypothetical protein
MAVDAIRILSPVVKKRIGSYFEDTWYNNYKENVENQNGDNS